MQGLSQIAERTGEGLLEGLLEAVPGYLQAVVRPRAHPMRTEGMNLRDQLSLGKGLRDLGMNRGKAVQPKQVAHPGIRVCA